MKKTQILTVLALSATLLAACTGKTTDPASGVDSTATDASLVTEKDTMTYGTSCEFGMSTFTLVTDAGDTLYLTRDAADGSMAQIYGDIDEDSVFPVVQMGGTWAVTDHTRLLAGINLSFPRYHNVAPAGDVMFRPSPLHMSVGAGLAF